MSDDLLFFSLETSTDVSAKNDIAVAADGGNKSQAPEFKKILEEQMSDSDKKIQTLRRQGSRLRISMRISRILS